MYQGTFKESFVTKYGHGVKVLTPTGEFTVFGKGPKPEFQAGTPLEFEAVQKGQSWSYSMLRVTPSALPPQHVAAPAQPLPPLIVPSHQPLPQGAASPINPDKERDMFVTGVVGRAMGGGTFSVNDIKLLTLAADEAWTALSLKRSGRSPAPQMAPQPAQNGPDGPPANDPRFQAPF